MAANAGPSDVTGATVTDTAPAGLTIGNWTCAGSGGASCPASGTGNISALVTIPNGGSVTFTVGAGDLDRVAGREPIGELPVAIATPGDALDLAQLHPDPAMLPAVQKLLEQPKLTRDLIVEFMRAPGVLAGQGNINN